MNCGEVHERDLLDRYINGTLPDNERDGFEQHFLGCASCAEGVETALEIRDALSRERPRSRLPVWVAAAAAVLLVVLLGIFWSLRQDEAGATQTAEAPRPSAPADAPPQADADETLRELAQITPPAYEETLLRGAEENTFRRAMRPYLEGRYTEAVRGLKDATDEDPQASEAWFFLGASLLLLGEAEPAIAALRRVADDRSSPFSEEARFYLAKALLCAGRLDEAKAELATLASSPGGPWAADASELLARLPSN